MRFVLLLAGALLLAGCPPDDGTVAPTFPDLMNTPAHGEAPTPSAPQELVRACVLLPSTGDSEDHGAEMRRGMAIAQAEVAAQPWRTRAIEWIEQDTKSTEAGAAEAFERCYGEGIRVVVGPVAPPAVSAILHVAKAHEALLVVPDLGPVPVSVWSDNILAVGSPSMHMGTVAARDALEGRQLRKAAVLHVGGVFGTSLADRFVEGFEGGGGSILVRKELPSDRVDLWRAAALEAGLAGAQALFVVTPGELAETVADSMTEDPLSQAHVWFIDWAMFPTVIDAVGDVDAIRRTHWVNRPEPGGEFAQTYLARYQAQPEYSAAHGYDATFVAANAIEGAKELEGPQIAQVGRVLEGMKGAFGTGTLVEQGDLRVLDSASWQIFEPVRNEDGATWRFEASSR